MSSSCSYASAAISRALSKKGGVHPIPRVPVRLDQSRDRARHHPLSADGLTVHCCRTCSSRTFVALPRSWLLPCWSRYTAWRRRRSCWLRRPPSRIPGCLAASCLFSRRRPGLTLMSSPKARVRPLRLGATFDPEFLGRLGLGKLQANSAEARSWYNRARDLGAVDGERQLYSLGTR